MLFEPFHAFVYSRLKYSTYFLLV